MSIQVGISVFVVQNRKILLNRRLSSPGAGSYQIPGGKLEFGETPEECAKRELYEESGLIAKRMIVGPWINSIFPDEKLHFITIFFYVTEWKGTPTRMEPDKAEDWEWYDLDAGIPTSLLGSLANYFKKYKIDDLMLATSGR